MGVPLDVAIVGVPKAGTSSLYDWLAMHPQIQASNPKETYYFADPGQASAQAANFASGGWDGFEEFFDGPTAGRKRLEASAINLFQRTARIEFARLDPQPQILVAVRCPAEQIRSSYYFHKHATRIDPELDFASYVRALMTGDHDTLKRAVPYPDVREMLEQSMDWNEYARWLDLWREDFPADRIMVLTLEELSAEPVEVLTRICSRLELDPHQLDAAAAVPRNVTGARTMASPSRLARLGKRLVPQGQVRDRLAAWDRRRRIGGTLGAPSDDEEDILRELGQRYAKSDRELADRFGVDTSNWWSSGTR